MKVQYQQEKAYLKRSIDQNSANKNIFVIRMQ